jgi:hypothetical protein
VIRFIERRGVYRGLLGGSRPWTILWLLLAVRGAFYRLVRHEPEIVWRGKLETGETLIISGGDKEPRVIGR